MGWNKLKEYIVKKFWKNPQGRRVAGVVNTKLKDYNNEYLWRLFRKYAIKSEDNYMFNDDSLEVLDIIF